jgi:hypothetical protein
MDEEHKTLGFNPNDPQAWEPDEPLRTKTGRVLTDADIQALADEAERGYDLPAQRRRRVNVEDCIAMSEDGDWYAFRRDGSTSRPQIMAAVCRDGEEHGAAWFEILEAFKVLAGFVCPDPEMGEGHWKQCAHLHRPGAVPAWIVERRKP